MTSRSVGAQELCLTGSQVLIVLPEHLKTEELALDLLSPDPAELHIIITAFWVGGPKTNCRFIDSLGGLRKLSINLITKKREQRNIIQGKKGMRQSPGETRHKRLRGFFPI